MTHEPPPVRREPMFNVPGVVVACCALLLAVHAFRLWISVETDNRLVAALAFVPARLSLALHLFPDRLTASYHALVDHNPMIASQVQFLLGDGSAHWWTLATYALVHASWAHVGFNCIWLVAFGSAVARRFAALRFLALLAVSAIMGALAQYLAEPASFQIVIGASAAVAGAMGAAIRFVFRPADAPARMFDRTRSNDVYRQPALSLRETFTTRASIVFVVFWFATNLLFGLFPGLEGIGDEPIAWQAHIGGFLAGLLLFPLFDRRHPPALPVEPAPEPEPTR